MMTLLWGGDAVEAGSEGEEEEEEEEAPSIQVEITHELLEGMSQTELKDACKARGISTCGTKAKLRERLWEGKDTKVGAPKKKRKDNPMSGLPTSAYWELLTPDPEPVPHPINVDDKLRPPSELEAPELNPRFKYTEVFDRAPFLGTTEHLPISVKRKVSPDKRKRRKTGLLSRPDMAARVEPVTYTTRNEGGPNMEHIQRYGLGLHSHPMDWFTSLVPLTPDANLEPLEECDAIGDQKTKFCVSNWRAYLNSKADRAGAGYQGWTYEGRWRQFSDRDVHKCLGTITLDSVAPSH